MFAALIHGVMADFGTPNNDQESMSNFSETCLNLVPVVRVLGECAAKPGQSHFFKVSAQ